MYKKRWLAVVTIALASGIAALPVTPSMADTTDVDGVTGIVDPGIRELEVVDVAPDPNAAAEIIPVPDIEQVTDDAELLVETPTNEGADEAAEPAESGPAEASEGVAPPDPVATEAPLVTPPIATAVPVAAAGWDWNWPPTGHPPIDWSESPSPMDPGPQWQYWLNDHKVSWYGDSTPAHMNLYPLPSGADYACAAPDDPNVRNDLGQDPFANKWPVIRASQGISPLHQGPVTYDLLSSDCAVQWGIGPGDEVIVHSEYLETVDGAIVFDFDRFVSEGNGWTEESGNWVSIADPVYVIRADNSVVTINLNTATVSGAVIPPVEPPAVDPPAIDPPIVEPPVVEAAQPAPVALAETGFDGAPILIAFALLVAGVTATVIGRRKVPALSASNRRNRGRKAAGLGVLIFTVIAGITTGPGAIAAEGDAERGYPVIAPEWYTTTPAFVHGEGPPSPHKDESLRDQGLVATYYMPGGSGPSHGQADITLVYSLPSSKAPIETVDFDLTAFEDLGTDLGTAFTDGLTLPRTVDETNEPQPTIEIRESMISVTRPDMPDDCSAEDPSDYEFQAALLGDNGFKYLADIDVQFGERPSHVQSQFDSKCEATALAEQEERIAETDALVAQQLAIESPDQAQAAGQASYVPMDQGYNWWPVIAIGSGVVIVIWLVWRFDLRSKVRSLIPASRTSAKRRFDDDGNPLNDQPDHSEQHVSPKSSKRVAEMIFGKPRDRQDESGYDLDA